MVYYTKVLLSVTEKDRRCPEEICSVDPNSSCPNPYGMTSGARQKQDKSKTKAINIASRQDLCLKYSFATWPPLASPGLTWPPLAPLVSLGLLWSPWPHLAVTLHLALLSAGAGAHLVTSPLSSPHSFLLSPHVVTSSLSSPPCHPDFLLSTYGLQGVGLTSWWRRYRCR